MTYKLKSKIAFVSKKSGTFHLVVGAVMAPELFAAHLIRTRTNIADYDLFVSCPRKDICSRTSAILREHRKGTLLDNESKLRGYLSPRQLQVAHFVGQGLTNKETAARLNICVSTVKHYMVEIFRKLGFSSRMQLFLFMHGESEK